MDGITSFQTGYAVQGGSRPVADPVTSTEDAVSSEAAASNVAVSNQVTPTAQSNPDSKGDGENPKEPSDKQIQDAIKSINKHANGTEAVFGIHEKTNRVTIKIVDKKTKEVIKEVPPEKTLDLIAKAWELAGIMVDEKR
ncbi:MAG: flagellar protein FlaG [Lachnospiraceae bacterium]|nr:flagellar protein FlaG [Lachnospiraceae bacterium]